MLFTCTKHQASVTKYKTPLDDGTNGQPEPDFERNEIPHALHKRCIYRTCHNEHMLAVVLVNTSLHTLLKHETHVRKASVLTN